MATTPIADSCNGHIVGENIATQLREATTLPTIDFNSADYQFPNFNGPEYTLPPRLTTAELTTTEVGGAGVFDKLMTAVRNHLMAEFDKGRIVGQEYANAYVALTSTAMSNAVQFLTSRDISYYQALTARSEAQRLATMLVTERANAKTAQVQFAAVTLQAKATETEIATKKMSLSVLDAEYCIKKAQKEGAIIDNNTKTYNLSTMLPAQLKLVNEQMEAQRAQTHNNRTDGTAVAGSVGKQKDLYAQQITSYQRDAEVKAARLFQEVWTVMRSTDEGLAPQTGFDPNAVSGVMQKVRQSHGLT